MTGERFRRLAEPRTALLHDLDRTEALGRTAIEEVSGGFVGDGRLVDGVLLVRALDRVFCRCIEDLPALCHAVLSAAAERRVGSDSGAVARERFVRRLMLVRLNDVADAPPGVRALRALLFADGLMERGGRAARDWSAWALQHSGVPSRPAKAPAWDGLRTDAFALARVAAAADTRDRELATAIVEHAGASKARGPARVAARLLRRLWQTAGRPWRNGPRDGPELGGGPTVGDDDGR